jgi:hypothetical protein
MAIAEALPGAATTDEGLRRGLSRFHALAIVMGAMIGTGIYLRPASIAQLVQSPSRILAVWVVAGLFSFAGALTYAELASRLPRSGGEYAFLHEMLGESPAFLFGWITVRLLTLCLDREWSSLVAIGLDSALPLRHSPARSYSPERRSNAAQRNHRDFTRDRALLTCPGGEHRAERHRQGYPRRLFPPPRSRSCAAAWPPSHWPGWGRVSAVILSQSAIRR